MTEHQYANFHTDWFHRLMEYIEGKPNNKGVSIGEMRKAIEPDWVSALELLTAHNHACHAGILTEGVDGCVWFDRDVLSGFTQDTDTSILITAPCVFDCEVEPC